MKFKLTVAPGKLSSLGPLSVYVADATPKTVSFG